MAFSYGYETDRRLRRLCKILGVDPKLVRSIALSDKTPDGICEQVEIVRYLTPGEIKAIESGKDGER